MTKNKKGLPVRWFRRISAGAVGVVMLNGSHSLALQLGVDESVTVDIISMTLSLVMGIAWFWLPVASDNKKEDHHGEPRTRTIPETP